MDIDLRKIQDFFAADRFAAGAGITVEAAAPERVVCAMAVTPRHLNAAGGVQGGAIFTLADLAFAVHSNLGLAMGASSGVTVGQSNSISFLRAPRGPKLKACSSCLSRGRNISVYHVEVTDDEGLVAVMTGSGFTKDSSGAR
ncbi:MAG: PaaI family thioesterase [Gracilibacteraceae bacterium]|jgi:acyl-CoA thioesterase|nr:PaaI family thioesterase [Gracilibacteraceae bacterium]